MSAKACCVKVKNCGGKAAGMADSQVFLIELAGEKLDPEIEKNIVEVWDGFLARMEAIEEKLLANTP